MTVPANRLDDSFAPRPVPGAVSVPVGQDTVVLDGWRIAAALDPVGTVLWEAFDGATPLSELIDDVAHSADVPTARAVVMDFVRSVGGLGLLDGVGPPDDAPTLVPLDGITRVSRVGETVEDVVGTDLAGQPARLSDRLDRPVLLVNWSPHCGYCASIAEELVELHPALDRAGVTLVLIGNGGAEANRALVDSVGMSAPVIVADPASLGPFAGYGTPAAFHVGTDGRLADVPAAGNVDVPALARRLAGIDEPDTDEGSSAVRYLLERGGSCPTGVIDDPRTRWAGRRVYRLADFHVGIRYDTDSTARRLDDLFDAPVVDDDRAGHSYSVSLPAGGDGAPVTSLNLLVGSGRVLVRSRYPDRVLRALLWRLDDAVVAHEPVPGRLRVDATMVRVGASAILLQARLHMLGDRLQALLARRGVAVADVPFPEIDLGTGEVVIPEIALAHDPTALRGEEPEVRSRSELEPVLPGRYPLLGWGVVHPSDATVTRFSPAEAAAATMTFVQDVDDAVTRVRLLGDLFERTSGCGLWYDSDDGYVDAVCQAFGVS